MSINTTQMLSNAFGEEIASSTGSEIGKRCSDDMQVKVNGKVITFSMRDYIALKAYFMENTVYPQQQPINYKDNPYELPLITC